MPTAVWGQARAVSTSSFTGARRAPIFPPQIRRALLCAFYLERDELMRAEAEALVEQIKQSMGLLRRHL